MKRLLMALLTCLVIVGCSGCSKSEPAPAGGGAAQTEENAGGGETE